MDQTLHKADFVGWLRRTWMTILRTAEAIEPNPMEDMFNRLDRLEREVASLKKWK